MNTKMTEQKFRDWASTADFSISQEIDGATDIDKHAGFDDDGQPILVPGAYAYAWKAFSADGVEISYSRSVEWTGSTAERFEDDYTDDDIGEGGETWQVNGLEIVDEDGDTLSNWERDEILREVLEAHPQDITDIDFEALLPAVKTEDIDIDEEDEAMETITLENDNAPDVRFTGELVASSSSSPDTSSSYHSGSTGRWTTLKLYKTKGGKFVAQSVGHTQWQGEHDRYKVAVCETEADVINFFGHGWLAKDLYEEAGISDVTEVE